MKHNKMEMSSICGYVYIGKIENLVCNAFFYCILVFPCSFPYGYTHASRRM